MASTSSKFWICLCFSALLVLSVSADEEEEVASSHVLTLHATNFDDEVAKHDFILVEFYAPWCGHCKKLEPEYEKAASALSKHDPPIVLAKMDANDEANKELASKYDMNGYPTLKILRNKGKNIKDYKGPREADGIVEYLKKQVGPASAIISSAEDADNIIDNNKVLIVGIFPEFSGEEFDNFITVAEKLRSEYDFVHTMEAKFIPKGESAVNCPTIRLLKPFDELFVDFHDFHVDAIEKFIEEASMPLVTMYNSDPNNLPFVIKFFNGGSAKAMLFLNFTGENFEEFKSNSIDIAKLYKDENITFLMGDLEVGQRAFQYFGLREDQAPLIVIHTTDSQKYLKANVEPAQVATWLKEYMDGNVKPYMKSEPIPEVNNEPVKVVVADSLHDVVFGSGKNVLLEFYAPWCGHCQQLAPILDEVAISFESDPDVIIAKMDATANDFPKEFEVKGYPTIYFSSASRKLVQYEADRSKENIVDFIQKNRYVIEGVTQPESTENTTQPDNLKDEL